MRADTSYIGSAAQVTTYTYDQWERVRTMTDPVGTWTTGYETLRGYADTLLTPLGDTLTYVHDEQGRAVGPYIRSNGLRHWTELDWNVNESLDSVGTTTNAVGGNFVSGRYLRPNPVDDGYIALAPVWVEQHGMGAPIDSLQDVVAYDGWERLTSWTGLKNGVSVVAETYQFDRTGNISQPTGAATYNVVTDRLMSRVEPGGNRTFVYDRAGNLVQQTKVSTGEVRTFGYDGLNRLVSMRQDGVLMVRYAYDVLGRRIAKRVYSSASDGVPGYTRFIYHGDNVAFQADSAGTMGLRFTWGLGTDDLRAVGDAAGQAYYIVQDKLGSVRGLIARDGTWRASVRFNPYGDIVALDSAGAKPPVRYAWTGREFDEETGWYYHRARYYSPLLRRFVQEDPIGYSGGMNLYAYVGGQALEATDPTGTQTPCAMSGGCEAGGGKVPSGRESGMGAIRGGGPSVLIDGVPVSSMAGGAYLNGISYGDFLTESMNVQTANWLAANTAQRQATQLRAQSSGPRTLDGKELVLYSDICGVAACDQVRIFVVGRLGKNALTLGHDIYLGPQYDGPLLAHELTHVYQYEQWGAGKYYRTAAWTQFKNLFVNQYRWNYVPGKPFGRYGMEQQGRIVQDCFSVPGGRGCRVSPFQPR